MGQREQKDDTDRFVQAIAALSAAPERVSHLGRQLLSGEAGCLSSILVEFEETVLRRYLILQTEKEEKLFVDVAERRLTSVLAMPTNLEMTYSQLAGKALEDSDVHEVAALLSDFASSSANIYVSSALPGEHEEIDFGGISVRALQESGKEIQLSDVPEAYSRAINECKAHVQAMVVVLLDGQVLFSQGDTTLCEALTNRLVHLAPNRSKHQQVTLWQGGSSEVGVSMMVELDEARVATVGRRDVAAKLFAAWQNVANS